MAKELPILTGIDHPILRKKAKRVPKITKAILTLIEEMTATVIAAKGAGLAAPQIGRSERICLALIGKKMQALINPEILSRSPETTIAEEGCLSLPGLWIDVERSEEIILSCTTIDGRKREMSLKGWDARVVQHEVDHLEGKLIVDYKTSM